MSNVVLLHVTTTLDTPSEKVLQGAIDANATDVIVIGRNDKGALYFASSKADGAEVLWLMECAKIALFQAAELIPTRGE